MGKGKHAWVTKGQKMNERFNEVWTCGWHSEAATMLVPTHRRSFFRCGQLQ